MLETVDWTAEVIHHEMNQIVSEFQLKFPKIAMPLRVLLTGIAQSPSIDQVIVLMERDEVLVRIRQIEQFI